MKTDIMGITFDNVTMQQALEKAGEILAGDKTCYAVTPNAEIAYEALRDESLRALLNEADLVLPDGAGVVLASKGYPGHYEKGAAIEGTEQFDGLIFHMGTCVADGQLLTNGGRVLMCICTGDTLQAARDKVYAELQKIHCDNLFHRNDIAHWAL